jgi:hypothetical protein
MTNKPRLAAASPERAPAPLNILWGALPWLVMALITLALIVAIFGWRIV